MSERRYTEAEVEEIFERAARDQTSGARLPAREGSTLQELQAIGEEVGLPRELVARAARALDGGGGVQRSLLGLPIAVGTAVDLGRKVSDEEWEQLVIDLRRTFHAHGRVRVDGSFREWRNGNLYALVEPGDQGDRLRLGTTRGQSRRLIAGGAALTGIALAVLIAGVLTGTLGATLDGPIILGLIGGGLFGAGALPLRGWSATRRAQMEAVAQRALALIEGSGETEAGD